MDVPCIYVGCGNFALQRLEVLINETKFNPVACVDLDVKNAKKNLTLIREIKKRIYQVKFIQALQKLKKNMMLKCVLFLYLRTSTQN